MSFWEEVVQPARGHRALSDAWDNIRRNASFRPTIYIGLGGIGSMVVRKMKEKVQALIPDEDVRRCFAYLAVDTHTRERTDILSQNEYLELSVGVDPRQVANQPEHQRALGWFNQLTGRWAPPSIRGGANKLRILGRFAFCFSPTLTRFCDMLRSALDQVQRFLDIIATGLETKIYIISSLAGGTGAGVLLDVIAVTRHLVREGKHSAILVLPDVLRGEAPAIDLPDLYSNAYATLKEIYRVLLQPVHVSYNVPGLDSVTIDRLPNPVYVLAASNENGLGIVTTAAELADIIVNYLLLEIQTPLEISMGQPKVQDAENVDFQSPGNLGMYRCFSSIGVVRFGFPADIASDLFTWSILSSALQEEIQEGNREQLDREVDAWVHEQGLSEAAKDQLQDQIRKDSQGQPLGVMIDVMGRLENVPRRDLPATCDHLTQEFLQALKNQYRDVLKKNAERIRAEAQEALQVRFQGAMQERSLGYALAWVKALTNQLDTERKALSEEYSQSQSELAKNKQLLEDAIRNVQQAVQSSFLGRRRRVRAALSAFELELNAYLNSHLVLWAREEGLQVYDNLIEECNSIANRWDPVCQRLKAIRDHVRQESQRRIQDLDRMANINSRGPGNRFSLVDGNQMRLLFQDKVTPDQEANLARDARRRWRNEGLLGAALALDVKEWIAQASATIRQWTTQEIIGKIDIIKIIDRFYGDPSSAGQLFMNIRTLSTPLFPLDRNFAETAYPTYWVVAAHPSIRDELKRYLTPYVPQGAGISDAYFPDPHEVVIYTIVHGYTPHSLRFIGELKAHYDRLQGQYVRFRTQNRPHRPIHVWLDAEVAGELIPPLPEEEETYELFIVGRAFSYLFPDPPDPKKNKAFIYNRGARYYILDEDGREQLVGEGLHNAIEGLEHRPDWRNLIQRRSADQVRQAGIDIIRQRLLEEYIPTVLEPEIETARRNNDSERLQLLQTLRKALTNYIRRELTTGKV